MPIDLQPPSDRILCRLLPAETTTAFGLALPEQAQRDSQRAIVLAVGEGKYLEDGLRYPLGIYIADAAPGVGNIGYLAPGDEVILPAVGGSSLDYDDGEVISILAESVLARVG